MPRAWALGGNFKKNGGNFGKENPWSVRLVDVRRRWDFHYERSVFCA